METILIMVIVAAAIIGLVVGLIKGYTKTSAWGGTAVFTLLIARPISSKIIRDSAKGSATTGIAILATTIGVLLVLMLVFYCVKRAAAKGINDSKTLSHYKNYDKREEQTEQVLAALDDGDKRAYRKNQKRKIKDKSGPWGVVNVIFGGITGVLNGACVAVIITFCLLFVVDLANIQFLNDTFGSVMAGGLWQNFGAKYGFDLILVALLCASVRSGFKRGVFCWLGIIIIIALLGGAGYLSYHLAFNVEAFATPAQNLADGALTTLLGQYKDTLASAGIELITIAKILIAVGVFVVLLIPVIILAVFIPKWIDSLTDTVVIGFVDGVLGAILSVAAIVAVFMLVGGVLYTLNDLEFMVKINAFMDNSPIFNSFYAYNPLTPTGIFDSLPIRDWFNPPEPSETPATPEPSETPQTALNLFIW